MKLAKKRANEIRNQLGLGQGPISDVFTLIEDIGIILFKKYIQNSSLSAIFMKDTRNHLVIINSNRTLGHQTFSAAHELYHYYFDKQLLGGICSVNSVGQKNEIEEMADMFASHFLMPDDGVIAIAEKRKNKDGSLDPFDMVFLQQYFKVSWIALLKKLEYLGYIQNAYNYKDIGITRLTQVLGYDTSLVTKSMDNYISKKYIETALKCYESDEISEKKLIEYLEDIDADISIIDGMDRIISGGTTNGEEYED